MSDECGMMNGKPAAFHLPPENERLLEIAITAG
jgi:hypothetical protein